MATGIQNWSQTPATNASADSSINWAEGQSPGSVNDSARAVMARLADYYKDLSGITTGGTSTAYTITTNRAFAASAIMDGAVICIKPNADSGASPTLAVDGLTARAINNSTGVAITTGALKTGTPYYVIYIHASTEFILLGAIAALPALTGPCPVGGIMDFAGSTAPTGWLLCYGQSLLRASYPALFVAIGTLHGAADGTHFSLPDLRGRVIAGVDNMGGVSSDRLPGAVTSFNGDVFGSTGGEETHTMTTGELVLHGHAAGTLQVSAVSSVSRDGWGTGGGGPPNGGTAITSGRIIVGSGIVENSEQLESLRGASNDIAASTITATGSTASSGSSTPFSIVQPTIVMNKIIFAGV